MIERSGGLDAGHDALARGAPRPGRGREGIGRHRPPVRGPARRRRRARLVEARLRRRRHRRSTERWKRFDEALVVLRALLNARSGRAALPRASGVELAPGSPSARRRFRCGLGAGARRPASLVWRGRATAGSRSAYNTTPERVRGRSCAAIWRARWRIAAARGRLSATASPRCGRGCRDDPADCDRVLTDVARSAPESRSRRAARAGLRRLRGALRRAPLPLCRGRLPARRSVGRWATSGRQLELVASAVAPAIRHS